MSATGPFSTIRPLKSKIKPTVTFSLVSISITTRRNKNTHKHKHDKTLRSVHFGVVVVELINFKCGGIVRNEIW